MSRSMVKVMPAWMPEGMRGLLVLDEDALMRVERRAEHRIVRDREGGHEVGARAEEAVIVVAHREEAAVMAVVAMRGGALALLDDRVDCRLGRGEVGDGAHALERDVVGAELRGRIAAEEDALAEMAREHGEAVADAPIEMADGIVVLRRRHEAARNVAALVMGGVRELAAVGLVDPFRPLEEDEVLERGVGEGRERDHHPVRMVAGRDGEVRPREMRRAADRAGQVAGEREVGHLLDGDGKDRVPPVPHGVGLLGPQAVLGAALQAPRGIEVGAHEVVLDRRRLGEEIDQLLTRLDDDARLGGRHARQGSAGGGTGVGG